MLPVGQHPWRPWRLWRLRRHWRCLQKCLQWHWQLLRWWWWHVVQNQRSDWCWQEVHQHQDCWDLGENDLRMAYKHGTLSNNCVNYSPIDSFPGSIPRSPDTIEPSERCKGPAGDM